MKTCPSCGANVTVLIKQCVFPEPLQFDFAFSINIAGHVLKNSPEDTKRALGKLALH